MYLSDDLKSPDLNVIYFFFFLEVTYPCFGTPLEKLGEHKLGFRVWFFCMLLCGVYMCARVHKYKM